MDPGLDQGYYFCNGFDFWGLCSPGGLIRSRTRCICYTHIHLDRLCNEVTNTVHDSADRSLQLMDLGIGTISGGLNQALLSETVLKRVTLGTVRHDRQLSMSTSPTVTRPAVTH